MSFWKLAQLWIRKSCKSGLAAPTSLLVLEADALVVVVQRDLVPLVQQVFGSFSDELVRGVGVLLREIRVSDGPDSVRVSVTKSRLERSVMIAVAPSGGVKCRIPKTSQSDNGAGQTPIQSAWRERRDARSPRRCGKRSRGTGETLVVGAVAWAVRVENRDDKTRTLVIAADTAGCLNVFGSSLGLAEDDHEAEPGDVQTNGDHVRRQSNVDALLLLESAVTGGAWRRRPCRWLRGKSAQGRPRRFAVGEEAFSLADACAAAISREPGCRPHPRRCGAFRPAPAGC